jgi:diguanylate cyclase (GGDEF)-like protein
MNKPVRVLIVDDSEEDSELLVYELERGGYNPVYLRVDTPAAMMAALNQQPWDIVLADYSIPQFSATVALALLQEKQLDIPFIIVSGSIGDETAAAAMTAGAHDYLLKAKLARLVPALERELREAQVRQEHKQALFKLEYLAFNDTLTGLPNQRSFLNSIQKRIEQSQRKLHGLFAVLFLDIDRYQIVKYSLGHLLAEQLLVAIARRLETYLNPEDILARVGTDEFALLLGDIQNPQSAQDRADQIQTALKTPFKLDGLVVSSSTSIGIVLSTIGYDQPEDFLRGADMAMHHARTQGRGGSAIFDRAMQTHAVERLQLETDLQRAIKCQQLHLNYQPIVSLTTGRVVGFEALVRWQDPQRGMVSPSEFIPMAEETGLIVSLGEWVLEEACRRLSLWQQQFPNSSPLSMSVNLSARELVQPGLIERIDELCFAFRLKAESLKLEITESILLENAEAAATILAQLKQRQIQISIDDFGTGYSSLSYLHRLPIDTLKIDRSFISCIDKQGKNLDIVKAIIPLAHSLKLDVVAEGVETEEQLLKLKALGCEYGQGYFFSPPLNDEAVVALIATMPRMEIEKKKFVTAIAAHSLRRKNSGADDFLKASDSRELRRVSSN